MRYQLKIDDKQFAVEIGEIVSGCVQVNVNGRPYSVSLGESAAPTPEAATPRPSPRPALQQAPVVPKVAAVAPKAPTPPPRPVSVSDTGTVAAPIPGLIVKLNVAVGDSVTAGQTVVIMEAMKMENNLTCAVSGTVQEIRVQKGSEVATGDVIMIIA